MSACGFGKLLKSKITLLSFVFYLAIACLIALLIVEVYERSHIFVLLSFLAYMGGYVGGEGVWIELWQKSKNKKRILERFAMLIPSIISVIIFLIFFRELNMEKMIFCLIIIISYSLGIFSSYRFMYK